MAFDQDTTTDQVLEGVDLTGKLALVTGAASGLGEETVRALASKGCAVVLLGRNGEALDEAKQRVQSQVSGAQLSLGVCDLASFESIRSYAASFAKQHDKLDLLINNAGVMCCPEARTVDGFEMQFGTNHLGHFLLTNLLLPALKAAGESRIVSLSSSGHRMGELDLDDVNFEKRGYDAWRAYGQSKTANALFAVELERRFAGEGVHAFSVHPGVIMTKLGRHLTSETMAIMMERAKEEAEASGRPPSGPPTFKEVPAGAATQVWAAVAPELAEHGGAYLADCGVGVLDGDPNGRGYLARAVDPEAARALWDASVKMVGL